MSYSKLPTEVKQMIVDKVKRADEATRERIEDFEKTTIYRRQTLPNALLSIRGGQLAGESLKMLAQVDRRTREICWPKLYETLALSKTKGDTFECYIVDLPIFDVFTHLEVDACDKKEEFVYFTTHILRRLSNVTRLSIGSSSIVDLIFDDNYHERYWRARDRLVEFAKQITEWKFRIDLINSVSTLVAANASELLKLSIEYENLGGSIDWNAGFPNLVKDCRNLQTLSLALPRIHSAHAPPIVFLETLYVEFPFVDTLTSLSISVPTSLSRSNTDLELSSIKFASLFPNLQRLTLDAFTCDAVLGVDWPIEVEDEPLATVLPNVTELNLAFGPIDAFSNLLSVLYLPRLLHLNLRFNSPDEEWLPECGDESGTAFMQLAYDIHPFVNTPNSRLFLHLSTRTLAPRKQVMQAFRMFLTDRINLTYDWSEGDTSNKVTLDDGSREDALYKVVDASKLLADQVVKEVERLTRTYDVDGALKVLESLQAFKEYQRWMKD